MLQVVVTTPCGDTATCRENAPRPSRALQGHRTPPALVVMLLIWNSVGSTGRVSSWGIPLTHVRHLLGGAIT
jgi:hypothetical protein